MDSWEKSTPSVNLHSKTGSTPFVAKGLSEPKVLAIEVAGVNILSQVCKHWRPYLLPFKRKMDVSYILKKLNSLSIFSLENKSFYAFPMKDL